MPKRKKPVCRPFVLSLTADQRHSLRSQGAVSTVIRQALRDFDFGAYQPKLEARRQISVRLSAGLRKPLEKAAKRAGVPQAQVVLAALNKFFTKRRRVKK